jgi:acyl-coenzyme A synthetase/AMP-(fatty) acid ligase
VKIAGRRINPAEVAARLRRLDGVREAWVGPSPGPHPLLGAVVVGDRPAGEWRDRLREELAAWKIPKKWILLPRLPVTPSGKVDSRALRTLLFPPTATPPPGA